MRIMMLTSLPSGGPDDVPVTTPPGTLLISGAEGIEITVKAAEGTVIGVPYYWQSGVWQPLLGDATVAPRQVKAVAGGVDIGHLYFNKPATPLWFAVLETGGGTVGFCDIREAEGSTVLSQQDVTGSGGGGGGGLTNAELRAAPVAVSATSLPLPSGAATYAAQTDGTQRTRLTDGTNNVAVSSAAPTGTEQGLIVRNIPSGTQPVSGTVTANQGTAAATASAWPIIVTDGTQTVTLLNSTPVGTEYALPVRPTLVAASTSSITSPSVTPTFGSILAANSAAVFRSFYNPNSSSIGLTLGGTGAVAPGMLLAPGQTWIMPSRSDGKLIWTGVVNGSTVTGGTLSIIVTEIT